MVAWVGEDSRKVGYKAQFYSQSINHIREESLRIFFFQYPTFERFFLILSWANQIQNQIFRTMYKIEHHIKLRKLFQNRPW